MGFPDFFLTWKTLTWQPQSCVVVVGGGEEDRVERNSLVIETRRVFWGGQKTAEECESHPDTTREAEEAKQDCSLGGRQWPLTGRRTYSLCPTLQDVLCSHWGQRQEELVSVLASSPLPMDALLQLLHKCRPCRAARSKETCPGSHCAELECRPQTHTLWPFLSPRLFTY